MSSVSGDPKSAVPVAVAQAPATRLADEAAQLRGLVLGAGLLAVLMGFFFWNFLSSQVRYAIHQQADWGHTLVIPLISGYFVYLNRDRLRRIPFKTTWVGLLPVVAGTAWYTFCWLGPPAARHHNLQGAGLAAVLFGLVLLFTGWRAMAILWFPLLYLIVFGQYVSPKLMNYVTYPLQDITARGAHLCLNLIGVDTDRSGNILTVWSGGVEHRLNIAEACSGMRMLMAFLALGVAMAYTGFKHLWQRVTLVLLGIPTAIFVNVLRVVTLAILSMYDSNFAAGDFHTFIGLLWLVPAFLMYLGLMWVLRHMVIEQDDLPEGATS